MNFVSIQAQQLLSKLIPDSFSVFMLLSYPLGEAGRLLPTSFLKLTKLLQDLILLLVTFLSIVTNT